MAADDRFLVKLLWGILSPSLTFTDSEAAGSDLLESGESQDVIRWKDDERLVIFDTEQLMEIVNARGISSSGNYESFGKQMRVSTLLSQQVLKLSQPRTTLSTWIEHPQILQASISSNSGRAMSSWVSSSAVQPAKC